jgi:hypothetical protein
VSDALERFVRWVCRDVRFHRLYPGTVELDRGDGTMDVTPDDAEIRGMGLPPLRPRAGLPATKVTADKGARVLVGFEAGNPKRPYIAEFASGRGTVEIDGSAAVACMNDPIEVLMTGPVGVQATINGYYVQPGTPPVVVPLPGVPLLGLPVVTIPPGTVTAIVQTGKPKWKA